MPLLERAADVLHILARRVDPDAGLHAGHDRQRARAALLQRVRFERQRDPESRFRKREPGRDDADDGVTPIVETKRRPDRSDVCAKTALPELLAQERDAVVADSVLIRQEYSAVERRDAQQ